MTQHLDVAAARLYVRLQGHVACRACRGRGARSPHRPLCRVGDGQGTLFDTDVDIDERAELATGGNDTLPYGRQPLIRPPGQRGTRVRRRVTDAIHLAEVDAHT